MRLGPPAVQDSMARRLLAARSTWHQECRGANQAQLSEGLQKQCGRPSIGKSDCQVMHWADDRGDVAGDPIVSNPRTRESGPADRGAFRFGAFCSAGLQSTII